MVVSPAACNWDTGAGRLDGAYLFGVEPLGAELRLWYLPAYPMDCGWSGPKCLLRLRGGCDPHAADSELIAIDLSRDPNGHWTPRGVFMSAHCFDDAACRWWDASDVDWQGNAPVIWVAEGKNANYRSRSSCDSGHWHFDTCDRNDRSQRFPIESNAQNIGTAARPFPHHASDPPCIDTTEAGLLRSAHERAGGLVGTECIWTDEVFRGWTGPDAAGVTAYAAYFGWVAELLRATR
jgi:hypothetical protein